MEAQSSCDALMLLFAVVLQPKPKAELGSSVYTVQSHVIHSGVQYLCVLATFAFLGHLQYQKSCYQRWGSSFVIETRVININTHRQ